MSCIICLEEGNNIITFEHDCGDNYKVHNVCLKQWNKLHHNQCFICRKDIITKEKNETKLPNRCVNCKIGIYIFICMLTIYILTISSYLFNNEIHMNYTQI